METKILIIAVVEHEGNILMRKKPDGSPPYKETWYLFGGQLQANIDPEEIIKDTLRQQTGIDISVSKQLSWDTEVKADLDGVVKQFVYLDMLCKYEGGELVAGEGIEKLEWIPKSELTNYDIVPPSIELFSKLGYNQ